MTRRDSVLIRTISVFGIGLVILAFGLHQLYQSSFFVERDERWLLIAFLPLVGAAIWLGASSAPALVDIVVAPIRRFNTRAVAVFILFSACLFLFVARYVLQAFPNSGDEIAYIMQAQTFAQGRLWVHTPAQMPFFRLYHFVDIGEKWLSPYAPGWAMVLSPVAALGLPLWIVNPIIGATILLMFFGLARRYVSREGAWIGLLLLGGSSFFILNASSYFSHAVTAFYGLAFAWSGFRYVEHGERRFALAAGVFIGLMGLTRTQNAVLFAAPFAITLAMTPGRRAGLVWFGLGGAPFAAALMAYNAQITGSALLPVANARRTEPIGHLGLRSIRETTRHFADLYIWTSPILLFGYIAAFFVGLSRRRLDFTDWIMPTTILFFLFYSGSGGEQYGPRYYFEAWPFAILSILKLIDPILSGAERGVRASWISSAVIASLVFELGYLPARFAQEHRVVVERQDVYTQARRQGLSNAVVIIASSVGATRPIAPNDLVRNGLWIGNQKVIYALDLGARRNETLRTLFPGRKFFAYFKGHLRWLH